MKTLRHLLRRLLHWLEPMGPAYAPERDGITESLRAAVAADAFAKEKNAQTYEARVDAMIDDFFAKYEDRNGRHHH